MTTELLGLRPPGVCDEQCSVVGHQLLLQLNGGRSIDVLGVVSDKSLGDGLSDGVDLGGVSSTLHADTDIEGGERLLAGNKDGLVHLETEDFRLNEVDRGAIDADESSALFCVGNGGCGLTHSTSVEFGFPEFLLPEPSFCRKFERPWSLKPFCRSAKRDEIEIETIQMRECYSRWS